MSEIKEAYVLKQVTTEFKNIKKGDLFRLSYLNDQGNAEYSDWHVCVESESGEGDVDARIHADSVYFLMGRPELIDIHLKDGKDLTKKPVIGGERVPEKPVIGGGPIGGGIIGGASSK